MKMLWFVAVCLACIFLSCGENRFCFINNPLDGSLVNGLVEVTFEPSLTSEDERIALWINDSLVALITSEPYSYTWNTAGYDHGSMHTVYAELFDQNHQLINTSSVSVSIYNNRAVLAEAFTQWDGCGYDALAEKILIDSLARYDDTIIIVIYHIDGPYNTDYSTERYAFYDLNLSTPFVIFDGTDVCWEQDPQQYDDVYEQSFLNGREVLPYFAVEAEGHVNEIYGVINTRAVALRDIDSADIRIFAVILEDSLPGLYITHNKICRQMYEMARRSSVACADTITASVMFTPDSTPDNIGAAVFVQNMETKQILQSAVVQLQYDDQ